MAKNNGFKSNESVLYVYTIYFNPSDFPGLYVVRKFACTATETTASPDATTHETLEQARAAIPNGYMCAGRIPEDDPVIVESWI